MEYYDWNKTLSYDAPITFVISMRGKGKTYGLRVQAIRDYLKDGSRFVGLTRYKDDLKGSNAIQNGWFDKIVLNNEFPNHIFKVNGRKAYIAKRPENDSDKPEWNLIGYFTALTDLHKDKQQTYANVRRIIFDEAVIDRRTHHRYLINEWDMLTNAFSSIAREIPGEPTKCRLYLLGNACDITNPYFNVMGIADEPKPGYSWHLGKLLLLHYLNATDDELSEMADTVVGRMSRNRTESNTILNGRFTTTHSELISKRPRNARYQAGFVFNESKYSIWVDSKGGYYYICKGVPKNASNVFAMTNADNTSVNMVNARRTLPIMRGLVEMHTYNALRFDSEATRAGFMRLLALFGVR